MNNAQDENGADSSVSLFVSLSLGEIARSSAGVISASIKKMGYGVMTMRVETACLDQPGPSAPMTKTSLVAHKSQAMCVREDWRVMRPRMVRKTGWS